MTPIPLLTSAMPIPIQMDGNPHRKRAYRKRALIRATVRNALTKRRYHGLHMRKLADFCGVSLQTLYNNFGTRDELLASSVEELLRIQLAHAENESGLTGRNIILVHCSQIVEVVKKDRQFMHAVFSALRDLPQDNPIAQNMRNTLVSTFRYHLNEMHRSNRLRSWVDPARFACSLHDAFTHVLCSMSTADIDCLELQQELKTRIGLPMLGAVRGPLAEEVQSILQS